jgi:WS/DGAT/MGAT family acyltransferase
MTQPPFELLSAVDAQLSYYDTPETPMNMGNVCVFEGGPLLDASGAFRLADVREAIASRLHLVPRYRRKLIEVPFLHPILVDDRDFDIADHVELIRLAAPGTEEQLKEAFARVHEGMLDRSRALWKIVFVEGLQDGRVGMIQKIHHAPFDGATTVRIMERLFDAVAQPAATEPAPPWDPAPPPHPLEVAAAVLQEQVHAAWKMGSGPPALDPQRGREWLETVDALRHFAPAPPTSLNRPVGPRRRFDWIPTTLAEVKRMRALVPGSKLNDVMLAAVAGGLRELFAGRGEDVESIRPRVFVPVDARDPAGAADQPGNRLSAMVLELPIDEPDPVARLATIAGEMARLKAGRQQAAMELLLDMANFTPPVLLAATGPQSQRSGSFMNLTVTNVPGPRHELYLLGAKMLELNPMLPIGNQLTVNVAVESYVDKLSIGVCCDPDAVPDLDELKGGIEDTLRELLARASARPASART